MFVLLLHQGKVLSYYNDILKSCNALDYHDLISCSVKLLTDYPEGSHLYKPERALQDIIYYINFSSFVLS